jgi:CMP/dCMP kinase
LSTDEVPTITIDGGAGTGKGTTRRLVAKRLGWHELDSGVIYRAIGFLVGQNDEVEYMVALARDLNIRFDGDKIWLNNHEKSAELRSDRCGMLASKVSAFQPVRDAVHELQLSFRQSPGLVADGRDQGQIFEGSCKFFLVCDARERAQRRYLEFEGKIPYEQILTEIKRRDQADGTRTVAPLRAHREAMIINTTPLTKEQVVEKVFTGYQSWLKDRRHQVISFGM